MEVLEIKVMAIHLRIVTGKRIGMVKINLTSLNQRRGLLVMEGQHDYFFSTMLHFVLLFGVCGIGVFTIGFVTVATACYALMYNHSIAYIFFFNK